MTRSPKPAVRDRSPLHPSALRLNDVHPGVHYIQFNKNLGILESGSFVSEPYVAKWGCISHTRYLVVRVLTDCGSTQERALVDLGIAPNSGEYWNRVNFTIRSKKRHLLPKPTGITSDMFDLDDDLDIFDRWDDLD